MGLQDEVSNCFIIMTIVLSEHLSVVIYSITLAYHNRCNQSNDSIRPLKLIQVEDAWENQCQQLTIGFTSNWLIKWHRIFWPIAKPSSVKPKQN